MAPTESTASVAEARAAIPEKQRRFKAAYDAAQAAQEALRLARIDLEVTLMAANGEFATDCPDRWQVTAAGLVRVEPQRVWATGSHGPWGWVS